jgi:SHS2 domain-containing protein
MTGAIEEIEHTADWAIRVRGRHMKELFTNAALGMAMLIADVGAVEPAIERRVELEEFDTETLLVSWLSELLWFTEEAGAIFVRFEIEELTPTRLQGTVWGGPAPGGMEQIKAVTFHDLQIVETGDGYEVTLVFDV